MIMPLHMEQRLLGAIEIKGSQINHFRWSQRLRLQQVANVLAPYFYRQQLLHSLSNISRLVLKHRFSDMEVFGANAAGIFFISDVCQELSQIFLCRSANIWLQSEERRDRFVLSGCSDAKVFEETKRDYDGKIVFLFREAHDTKPDASKHLLQAFASHNDKRGIEIHAGRLFINTSDLFKVGRYCANNKGTTSYHSDSEEQGVIRLYRDWVKLDPTQKRYGLFVQRKFREVMAFPLTRWIEELNRYEIIGFVSLHNDRFSNFSQHWRHTIRLVNDQIVIALEQIGFIKEEDILIRKAMLHEAKEQASSFAGEIENFDKRARYARHELAAIIKENGSLPVAVLERLQKLEQTHSMVETDLAKASASYRNLGEKLDHLASANVYAFLGINPHDITNEPVYINDFVREVMRGCGQRMKKNSITHNIEIKDSLIWSAHQESLRRVLQNILDNAAKYALQYSSIDIRADKTALTVSNRCFYDESLQGSWPFSPGKRGLAAKTKIEGWGYGLCSVKLFCEKILNWRCEFEQRRETPTSDKAIFSITIIRRH